MGQLAGRLKEILRGYGVEPSLHQPELDAISALEREAPKRAHALFTQLRERVAALRLREAHARVSRFPFLEGVPPLVPEGLTLKQVDRLIRRLDRDGAQAEGLLRAVEEARSLSQGLEERALDVPLAAFDRVPYEGLADAAERAESLRRRVAREARVQERLRAALQRARRLSPRTVAVPDLTSRVVPDPATADERLDAVEAELRDAERVNDAHAAVLRELRDPSVRTYSPAEERDLRRAADAAAGAPPDDAVARLGVLAESARGLRGRAAAKARAAARARKRGHAPPERGRRPTDAQDGYA